MPNKIFRTRRSSQQLINMALIGLFKHKNIGDALKEQILVSWIGHADLIAMSNKLPAADKKKVEKVVSRSRKIDGVGPVK